MTHNEGAMSHIEGEEMGDRASDTTRGKMRILDNQGHIVDNDFNNNRR